MGIKMCVYIKNISSNLNADRFQWDFKSKVIGILYNKNVGNRA